MNQVTNLVRLHLTSDAESYGRWSREAAVAARVYGPEAAAARFGAEIQQVLIQELNRSGIDGLWRDVLVQAITEVDFPAIARLLLEGVIHVSRS